MNKPPSWHEDLIKKGYKEPLAPPTPGIQATMASIASTIFHSTVQRLDSEALADMNDEGLHAPTLLEVLDLRYWTMLLDACLHSEEKGMRKLQELFDDLPNILSADDQDAEKMAVQTRMIDEALMVANQEAKSVTDNSGSQGKSRLLIIGSTPTRDVVTQRPKSLLTRLPIPEEEKDSILQYCADIEANQAAADLDKLEASGMGPSVPWLPPRQLELRLGGLENRMWMHPNINHLAPITVEMWKCWASLSEQEVATAISNAVNNEQPLKNGCKLTGAFPISAYDPKKCPITEGVHVRTRQDLPLGLQRDKKHRQNWWNVNRPFLRCGCPLNGPKDACSGKMIWFDHAIWCMIHNLDLFFPAKGHLCSKYAALVGWLETAARDAVKASVTFAYIRTMMIEGALEYATNPSGKLLAKYGDGAGVRKIERMIRPGSNAGIGQSSNLSFKRTLPDLNKESGNTPHKRAHIPGRGRGPSHHRPAYQGPGRGRGAYNYNQQRRFGGTSSSVFQHQVNGGGRQPSQTPEHPRESRFPNNDFQGGADGSSGGSNTTTISSPAFGRHISWD
jgi:hypothetical protein